MYGLKNSKSEGSVYSHTIALVRGSTSITREKVAGGSRRWVSLSKIRRVPLGNGRGSCCCARGGLLSAQTTFPDARSIMTTVEMLRELTTMWPSAVHANAFACVH